MLLRRCVKAMNNQQDICAYKGRVNLVYINAADVTALLQVFNDKIKSYYRFFILVYTTKFKGRTESAFL